MKKFFLNLNCVTVGKVKPLTVFLTSQSFSESDGGLRQIMKKNGRTLERLEETFKEDLSIPLSLDLVLLKKTTSFTISSFVNDKRPAFAGYLVLVIIPPGIHGLRPVLVVS